MEHTLKNIKNDIYKRTKLATVCRYMDENWTAVSNVRSICADIIEGYNLIIGERRFNLEVRVKNGGYRTFADGSTCKEYIFTISDLAKGKDLNGLLVCSPCGTVEDPWSIYDITFSLD